VSRTAKSVDAESHAEYRLRERADVDDNLQHEYASSHIVARSQGWRIPGMGLPVWSGGAIDVLDRRSGTTGNETPPMTEPRLVSGRGGLQARTLMATYVR
jgi:hypothetical protein